MKCLPLLIALLTVAAPCHSQADDAPAARPAEERTPGVIDELLENASVELVELETQIAREEERLERIMSELVQLRRQHAILSSAESAYLLGEELYNSGSIVWARDAYRSVIENFPGSAYQPDALFRLELISFELQDYEGALDYFQKLKQASPSYEFMDLAYIAAGLSTYNQSDFAGSRVFYQSVSRSGDYAVLSDYLSAVAFVEEKNTAAAISALQNIIDETGSSSSSDTELADRARIALAQIMVEDREDFQAAIDHYSRVSPFSPYYDVAMLGQVWTLMRLERYREAYRLAETVMSEVPNSELISEFELAQANCALGTENIDLAIRMYESLLQDRGETQDYYDLFLSSRSLAREEFELERERLDRIRLGLSELKEEAYTQGDMELVEMIEEEEVVLRNLFSEIGYLETVLSLPMEMDTETMEQELRRLIQRSRSETEVLTLAVGELREQTEMTGSQQDRQDLASVENEIERIRLALQDLASKFEGGMAAQHDWVQETQYGIAVATFMERELMRDSIQYLGAYYRNASEEAMAKGDTARAAAMDSMRTRQIAAINRKIDEAAVEVAGYFEDYLASYPDSRFSADVLIRLAQLYYDIDNLQHSQRQSAAGLGEYIPEDYSRSIELYEKILTDHPNSEVEDVALYSMGYCLESMMDFESAVENYKRLLREHPRSGLAAECNLRVGNYYFDILAYDSALVYFERILDYPGSSPNLFQHGLYKLGWTLYLKKEFSRSIATFAYLLEDNMAIDSLGISRRGDIRILNESREYMAYDFLEMQDMSPGAVDRAVAFLEDFGDSVTTVTVLKRMAEISSEMTNWDTSVQAYQALLRRIPYSPEAPLYQLKIAQAYEELGDQGRATEARDRLIAEYSRDSRWFDMVGDSTALSLADSLRGSSFEESIQYYLERTVATREDPFAFRQTNETLITRIENYLQQFPSSPRNYEYRFYLGDAYYHTAQYLTAGDVYYDVAMDSSSFQRQEDALNNAFSSYLIAYEEVAGADSASLREKLRETALIYNDLYPEGENVAFFLWASAPKFYNAGDFETARDMFGIIYDEHRGSGYAARSAKFIADSYQQEEMYSEAEEWYGLAADAASLTGEDLGADIEYLAASSAYNDAATLAESEDVEGLMNAAMRWEETAREHAGTEVAPVAMYDAAETYGKAGSINDAVRLFQELATDYPDYQNAPSGLLRAAYLLREDQQYTRAAQLYLEAHRRYPDSPDMTAALTSAAKSYEEAGSREMAIDVYRMIAEQGTATAAAVTEAHAKIGRYNYDRGSLTAARNDFENCLTVYDQYRDGRIMYPAMSAYHIGEISAKDYYALTPVTTENVEYKTQLFNVTVAGYNRTFSYLDDDYVFRAVLRIGKLQEDFANSVGFMDPPPGYSEEDVEDFYNTLMVVYDDYIQRAVSTYENGLQLAVTNGVRTEYTDSIATNLDLLLPGSSTNIGYSTAAADTAAVTDTTGTQPEDSIGDEEDTPPDGETPDPEEVETPAIEPEPLEAEEEGGGCFLWPF